MNRLKDHEKTFIKEACKTMLEASFRVFLAEAGRYGFYTNYAGTKCVSFELDYLLPCTLKISGNYIAKNPKLIGTGWGICTTSNLSVERFRHYFTAQSPYENIVCYTTLKDYLNAYDKTSRFKEIFVEDVNNLCQHQPLF